MCPQSHASSTHTLLRLCLPLIVAAILLAVWVALVAAQGPSKLTRVTTSSDADMRESDQPSLSDDGTRIAFQSDSDFLGEGRPQGVTEVWLYDTATMTVTRVTSALDSDRDSRDPSISGDGTKVAFCSDSDFLEEGRPDNVQEIWLYDTTTMTFTRVTSASHSDRYSRYPSLSGGGTKVAFHIDSDFLGQIILKNQWEIWLYDTATMTLTRVTTKAGSGDRDSGSPSLSADGTKIAFQSYSDFLGQGIPNTQLEIWLYDTATMTVTRVTTASPDGRDSYNPSISGDGTRIAFYSDSDFLGQGAVDDEVWLYDTATMTVTRITTASHPDRGSYNPSISGDGTRIAFESDSDLLGQSILKNQWEIWLYDTDTMTVTRVTTAASTGLRDSYNPSLNRGGSKIAFASDSDFLGQVIADGQYEIWLREYLPRLHLPLVLRSGG